MADTREIDLLARLKACNAEWGTNVAVDSATPTPTTVTVTAFQLLPVSLKSVAYPLIYAMPPAYEERDIASGLDEGIYTVNLYLLITPSTNKKHNDDGILQAISRAVYLQMAARVYFSQHRHLDTNASPGNELDFITDDIRLRFSTVGDISTPFGTHIGFLMALTVRTI